MEPFFGVNKPGLADASMYSRGKTRESEERAFAEALATDRERWWRGDQRLLEQADVPVAAALGPPGASASAFPVGTERDGTDGNRYLVAARRMVAVLARPN